jgi:hypothetical protein
MLWWPHDWRYMVYWPVVWLMSPAAAARRRPNELESPGQHKAERARRKFCPLTQYSTKLMPKLVLNSRLLVCCRNINSLRSSSCGSCNTTWMMSRKILRHIHRLYVNSWEYTFSCWLNNRFQLMDCSASIWWIIFKLSACTNEL